MRASITSSGQNKARKAFAPPARLSAASLKPREPALESFAENVVALQATAEGAWKIPEPLRDVMKPRRLCTKRFERCQTERAGGRRNRGAAGESGGGVRKLGGTDFRNWGTASARGGNGLASGGDARSYGGNGRPNRGGVSALRGTVARLRGDGETKRAAVFGLGGNRSGNPEGRFSAPPICRETGRPPASGSRENSILLPGHLGRADAGLGDPDLYRDLLGGHADLYRGDRHLLELERQRHLLRADPRLRRPQRLHCLQEQLHGAVQHLQEPLHGPRLLPVRLLRRPDRLLFELRPGPGDQLLLLIPIPKTA
jgi:hypothetical protein